jgi:hypothetical protein
LKVVESQDILINRITPVRVEDGHADLGLDKAIHGTGCIQLPQPGFPDESHLGQLQVT